MIHANTFISWFFDFLNVGILFLLVAYLAKSKFLPTIYNNIKEKNIFWSNLHLNRVALKEQKEGLLRSINQQRDYETYLKEHVDLWNAEYAKQYHEQEKRIIHSRQQAEERAALQQRNYSTQRTMKSIVHDTFAHVRADLLYKAQETQFGDNYITDILACMKKESQ